MMSTVTQGDKTRFMELIGEAENWTSIDDLLTACDKADFWTEDFLDSVAERAKKSHLRRLIRSLKDGSGWPLWASVETTNESGEPVRVYKQEFLFDVGDYRQVVKYHSERSAHHRKMASGYAKRCKERFDRQLLLDFDDREVDPKRPR